MGLSPGGYVRYVVMRTTLEERIRFGGMLSRKVKFRIYPCLSDLLQNKTIIMHLTPFKMYLVCMCESMGSIPLVKTKLNFQTATNIIFSK